MFSFDAYCLLTFKKLMEHPISSDSLSLVKNSVYILNKLIILELTADHADKPLLRGNIELQRIMDDIRRYLGPFPDIQPLPDGTTTDVSDECFE